MDWGRVFFDLNGRIGQQTFWVGVLMIVVGNIVLPMIPIVGGIAWFVLIWCGFAIYGKRLHDSGRSAWVHAVPWVVTTILTIMGFVIFGASLFPIIMDAINEVEPDSVSIGAVIAGAGGFALFGIFGAFVWVGYTIWVGLLEPTAKGEAYGPSLDRAPAA